MPAPSNTAAAPEPDTIDTGIANLDVHPLDERDLMDARDLVNADPAAAAPRFEILTLDADTGAEMVTASHWTMAAAVRALSNARNGTELRFGGVTLAHKAGTAVSFTAFRPA